jgi:hypothetical protein
VVLLRCVLFTVGYHVAIDTWECTVPPHTPDDAVAETAQRLLHVLQTALTSRGFTAKIHKTGWSLLAKNPRDGRLSQRVALAHGDDGALAWFWQWGGSGDEPPSHGLICHGEDVYQVTMRIVRVLSLNDDIITGAGNSGSH